jgi:60 kDa SS-A/Ro ribonucleoprotein
LALLNREKAKVDVVVIVSDNESWLDPSRRGATATMNEWARLKARNPGAKLICIDIQPYGSTQAPDSKGARKDIMNVGGFTDAVFDTMARFANGEARDWVEIVSEVEVKERRTRSRRMPGRTTFGCRCRGFESRSPGNRR